MRQGTTLALAAALGLIIVPAGIANAADDVRSLPDDWLGLWVAPLALLTRADVRAELALTPEQAESARKAFAEGKARAAALAGKTGPEALGARREVDEAQRRWLAAELKEDQRQRLAEIGLQWEGPSALVTRKFIRDHLDITDEQYHSLVEAWNRRNERRNKAGYNHDDEEQLAKDALAILNDRQRSRWKALLGEPFVVKTAKAQTRPRAAATTR